jgi:hypothetical protein
MKTNPVLKPVQQRLIDKLATKGLITAPSGNHRRVNPYSNVVVELCPLAAGLTDWIVSPHRGPDIDSGKLARNDWDRARMLFVTLWPDAYYSLID